MHLIIMYLPETNAISQILLAADFEAACAYVEALIPPGQEISKRALGTEAVYSTENLTFASVTAAKFVGPALPVVAAVSNGSIDHLVAPVPVELMVVDFDVRGCEPEALREIALGKCHGPAQTHTHIADVVGPAAVTQAQLAIGAALPPGD